MIRTNLKWLACALAAALPMVGCAASTGVIPATVSDNAGNRPPVAVDGDTVTFEQVTGPGHGIVTVSPDGTFTYTPNPGFSGADSFTFRANDGEADSNIASVTITVTAAPTGPNAPSNMTATWVNDGEILLQWTDNTTDEQGFRIERKANEESSFTQLVVVAAGNISYHDTTVGANGRYRYRAIAVRAAGDTGPSNEAVGYTTPAAPGSLAAVQTAADTVELTWQDNAAYEEQYRIERKEGPDRIHW